MVCYTADEQHEHYPLAQMVHAVNKLAQSRQGHSGYSVHEVDGHQKPVEEELVLELRPMAWLPQKTGVNLSMPVLHSPHTRVVEIVACGLLVTAELAVY